MKNVSDRLRAIAELVGQTDKLLDVGCDHGYLCIMLTESGCAKHCLATDINPGPLKKAKENILQFGLSDKIETRLSDGLHKVKPGEADTVVIAGMGGLLMKKILTEGEEVLKSAKCFILQPQSDIGLFRHFIIDFGLEIVDENFVIEAGKYYPMIKAVWKRDAVDNLRIADIFQDDYDRLETIFRYGPYLICKKNESLKIFLEKEKELLLGIKDELEKGEATETKRSKIDSLYEDLKYNSLAREMLEIKFLREVFG